MSFYRKVLTQYLTDLTVNLLKSEEQRPGRPLSLPPAAGLVVESDDRVWNNVAQQHPET